MKKLNFNKFEEIIQLIDLAENIPGFICLYPVKFQSSDTIMFLYIENNLLYIFYVTPKIFYNKVYYYKLFDKISMEAKDFLENGINGKFDINKYYYLKGSQFLPKNASYDDVVKAILNIDMNDAIDISKKF